MSWSIFETALPSSFSCVGTAEMTLRSIYLHTTLYINVKVISSYYYIRTLYSCTILYVWEDHLNKLHTLEACSLFSVVLTLRSF